MLQQSYSASGLHTSAAPSSHSAAALPSAEGVIDIDSFDPFGAGLPPSAPRGVGSIMLPGGGVNSVTGAPLASPVKEMFHVRPPPSSAAEELLNARDDASSTPSKDHAPPGSPFDGPAANFHAAPSKLTVMDYGDHHSHGTKTDTTSVALSKQVAASPPPPPPPPPPILSSSSTATSSAAKGGVSWPTLGPGSSSTPAAGGGAHHPAYPLASLSGKGAAKLFGGADLSAFMPSSSLRHGAP